VQNVGVNFAARSLLFASLVATAALPAQRRQPAGHPDHGLPVPGAVWAPYHTDPDHVTNRIFRACYLQSAPPAEVAGSLPREGGEKAEFFAPGWYFAKREGEAADARWFGGDGRQLPREGFDAKEAAALRADLAALDAEVIAGIKATPSLAIWFQHDLLRMARRLLDTDENPDLLAPLYAAARAVALPRATIVAAERGTFEFAQLAEVRADLDAAGWVELERRSTRLFDAEFVQLWSSVYVRMPKGNDLAAWFTKPEKGQKPRAVPIGAQAVLVQGIVALADDGKPAASPLVVEIRVQDLRNRDELSASNATTTRDGVDFAIWSLERETLRKRGGVARFADFRAVSLEAQELFRDYGTRKHTTYAAQCTLCHRRSNGPEEELAGFAVLRPHVGPRPVTDPAERRRKAEGEMAKFAAALAAK
jgi:hypothetical protein